MKLIPFVEALLRNFPGVSVSIADSLTGRRYVTITEQAVGEPTLAGIVANRMVMDYHDEEVSSGEYIRTFEFEADLLRDDFCFIPRYVSPRIVEVLSQSAEDMGMVQPDGYSIGEEPTVPEGEVADET